MDLSPPRSDRHYTPVKNTSQNMIFCFTVSGVIYHFHKTLKRQKFMPGTRSPPPPTPLQQRAKITTRISLHTYWYSKLHDCGYDVAFIRATQVQGSYEAPTSETFFIHLFLLWAIYIFVSFILFLHEKYYKKQSKGLSY